jgi:hypothetical protein
MSKSGQNEITSIQQMQREEQQSLLGRVGDPPFTFIAFTQLDWIGNKESKLLSETVIRCPAFQYAPTRPTVGQLNTGITLLLGLSKLRPSRQQYQRQPRVVKNYESQWKKRPHLERGKKRRRKLLLSSCLFCDSNLSLLWPPFACCITVSSRLPLAH